MFDDFFRGYLSALMFTAHVDDPEGQGDSLFEGPPGGQFEDEYPDPLETLLTETNISARDLATLYNDAIAFWQEHFLGDEDNAEIMFTTGSDFHFTRNGHGVGYWDRPDIYGADRAQELTEACKPYGTLEMTGTINDDGTRDIYFHN